MNVRFAFQASSAGLITAVSALLLAPLASAGAPERVELDRSVQQLRDEILLLNSQAQQVEDALLYPDATRTSFYFGVDISPLLIEEIVITIDDRPAITYRMGTEEATALLTSGGLLRVARANLDPGNHQLQVRLRGAYAVGKGDEPSPPFEGFYESSFEKGLSQGEVELMLTRPRRSNGPTLVLRDLKAVAP
ncbi:hypothetical protein JN531_001235 [Flagellatimonas centrodinii]|uniref:hypothetical protein n=1 Tax=Flagellatimonas centrodinii TaxID=2806210 RepID=UPI001FF027FA|nr:hypothetical protein [Flagellatimonas centrodinii]ULQ46921.1 hypothetical protein JN531_001235 [Flagellatimonas centrodinii]